MSNVHKIRNHNHTMKLKSIKKFDKWLINLSDKRIPDSTANFLSLGDNFGVSIIQFNIKDRLFTTLEVVKRFEAVCYKIPPKEVNDTDHTSECMITDSVQKFFHTRKHISNIDRHIICEFNKCKKFLHENNDIFVTRADKGQVTVIMNKNDYIMKMNELLDDQATYRKLKKDSIKPLTSKIH